MKNKILLSLLVLFILIIISLIFIKINNTEQEEKLVKEMNEISTLANVKFNELNQEKLQTYFDRTITKKDYAKVEKAFKTYFNDVISNIITIADTLEEENLTKMLTANNYQEDGPKFNKTLEYINNTKNKLNECKDKYYEYLKEEKIMSYIKDYKLNDYYIDLYKNHIIGNAEEEKDNNFVENNINEVINILDKTTKVINFLQENEGKWLIKNNKIILDTKELVNKYNELISGL